jgi:hypothetical protein
MKQKIFNLDSSKAFTPILMPKGQRPDIFRDILPLLLKPEFILCHRFKGKEHLSGHYGRKDFKYGNIKTDTAVVIDADYQAKIAEYERKGPVLFVAHDAGNDSAAAKYNELFSLMKYLKDGVVIDSLKLSPLPTIVPLPTRRSVWVLSFATKILPNALFIRLRGDQRIPSISNTQYRFIRGQRAVFSLFVFLRKGLWNLV